MIWRLATCGFAEFNAGSTWRRVQNQYQTGVGFCPRPKTNTKRVLGGFTKGGYAGRMPCAALVEGQMVGLRYQLTKRSR